MRLAQLMIGLRWGLIDLTIMLNQMCADYERKKTLLRLVLFSMISIFLCACSDDSSGSSKTYYMTNGYCYSSSGEQVATSKCENGYYLTNGVCYSSSGLQVSLSYCSSTSGYTLSNGYCYSTSTGQQVNISYCSTSSTTGYIFSNGYCYATSTGQMVNSSYCSGSSGASQCYGIYYYFSNTGYRAVTCNGSNCSGYTLLSQSGTQVYCQ